MEIENVKGILIEWGEMGPEMLSSSSSIAAIGELGDEGMGGVEEGDFVGGRTVRLRSVGLEQSIRISCAQLGLALSDHLGLRGDIGCINKNKTYYKHIIIKTSTYFMSLQDFMLIRRLI